MKRPHTHDGYRPAAPILATSLTHDADTAPLCRTPPSTPTPTLTMVQAAQAEWQRHQQQRNLEWEHLRKLETEAANREISRLELGH